MKIICSIIFMLLFNVLGMAQTEVKVRSSIDKAKVTTGDFFTFTITLDSIEGLELEIPEVGEKILGLRVVDFGRGEEGKDEGRVKTSRWYKLQADISGSYILPSLEIKYKDQNGLEKVLKTSEIFIEVESLLNNDGDNKNAQVQDIRDIKGLIPLGALITKWWFIAILLVILTILCIALLWYFTNRKRPIKENIIPPYETAFTEIEKLRQSDYLEKGNDKKYHFKLSIILREYFEAIYNINVTDMTHDEIKKNIGDSSHFSKVIKEKFVNILEKGELVKFADTVLTKEESQKLLQESYDFVESTRPIVQAEEESVI